MVVELARAGWRIVLVHGNGPQVGDELARNEAARRLVEPLPLGVLVAETAGWIGYMLQQSLQNALAAGRVPRDVVTVVTQTLVDRYDPALGRPTKPIGHALTEAEVARLREAGRAVGRDGAGDWRRMATSPRAARRRRARRWCGGWWSRARSCIAAGGGGPPVYEDPLLGLEGVDAVVDKDRVVGHSRGAARGRGADDPHQRRRGVRGVGHAGRAAHPPDDRRPGRGAHGRRRRSTRAA